MKTALQQPKIYIVASQTGTVPSRLIKRVTRARFNHVSISLDEQLDTMYSFARRHPYNPVWGGYVKESPLTGTFARFPKTQAHPGTVCRDPGAFGADVCPEKYIPL